MRIRHIFKRNGSAGIFLCIVLSAVILTEGVLYSAARIRSNEADLARCMRLQISQILCSYNRSLLENYGLYGLDSSSVNSKVFDACFSGKGDAVMTAEPENMISSADLKTGIADYMQIRMPAVASGEILSRFKGIYSGILDSDLFKNAKGSQSSEWLGYVKGFLGQKDKWGGVINSVVAAVETVDFTGKVKDLEEFASSFQEAAGRSATLYLQGESSTVLPDDFLNPDNLSNIMSYVDGYMNWEMPGIVDSLLINEYAVSFFDSKVEYIVDGDSKELESNLLGVPFTEIHGSNRADLEYLLTGIDNEIISFSIAETLIFDMRTIANTGIYLLDNEKMKKAKEIAEILSAAITLVSAGTVSIDPEALKFGVIYVWALKQGFQDVLKLIGGESVILFDHSALDDQEVLKGALMTDYRDYMRVLLLAVPEEWKLSRILTLLKKDCANELYKGVCLSVDYRGSLFRMEDSYDAYSAG